MDFKNFDKYSFGSKFLSSTFQAHAIGLNNKGGDGLYEYHKLLLGNYEGINFPVVFKQEGGKKISDILDTGTATLFLISDLLKDTFEEHSFSGWKTFPVTVLNYKEEEVAGYHGFSITGRCGEVDYSKCEIIEKQMVPNAPAMKYYKGIHVDLDKWDGSDFFIPEKYFGIIVSQKVRDVLMDIKATNVELVKLTEIEIPEFALSPRNTGEAHK